MLWCSFACLTTRIVHLDLVGDLSTGSFLLALIRFTARKGKPRTIWTDNGTNFIGAERELSILLKDLNQVKIQNYLSNKGVTSKFNPPSSPWMLGSWELIVKLTKQSLKSVLKDCPVYEESLRTFLKDIEFTLNSCPLLPLSDYTNDLDTLTTNHFLIGTRTFYFNPNIKCKKIDSQIRWKAAQTLSKMWNKPTRILTINGMVLVKDDNFTRLQWKLGQVIEVYTG